MSNHSNRAHALLSASSAHRWLHCTPSARLEATLPDTTSEYAQEGTLAHEIAELHLRKHFLEPMGPRKFSNALKKLEENPLYKPEMGSHVQTYVDYVQTVAHGYTSKPYIALERRLDFSHIVPEGFGSCDCIIICGNEMHVIDFKYGQGVSVSPVDNEQMKLYAISALREFGFLYRIDDVFLTIIQPRNQTDPRQWGISAEELTAWGESIRPTAQQAFDGAGEYCAGDWCRFCRARASCRERSGKMLQLEGFTKQPPALLSNEEIGPLIARVREMAKWADELDAHALQECLSGRDIPGYKAVEGRTTRALTDQDAAFHQLIMDGVNEATLYKRQPIGFTELDKLLGGKAKTEEALAGYLTLKPGKPTLVPESDKRPAYRPTTAAEDFGHLPLEDGLPPAANA